ncbi:LysR family transcriptional regulator [Pseudonocardia sichuanensis]
MDVHLRDLRYFVAIAEHLHVTRAAEALYVSQPTLSKQLRALEGQLRVRLFERDRRGVTLTPAGAALLPHARAVLDAWTEAEQALAAAAERERTTLVVGISTGLGRGLLPAVRARLAESAPHATLQVRQVGWGDPAAGLDASGADRTDAAFVWLPLPGDGERYAQVEIVREPSLIAMPAGHPLAGRTDLDISDVLDEPFLALPAAAGALRDFWLVTRARDGVPARIGAEIANTDETAEALLAGLGVCLLSAGNAPNVARPGIAIRPITGVEPSRLALAWRRDDRRPLLRALREAVQAAVSGAASPSGRPPAR